MGSIAETLLWTAASNTVVATGIALLALWIQRSGKRVSLAYGLWILVLIKLLTPPLLPIPVQTAGPEVAIETTVEPLSATIIAALAAGDLTALEQYAGALEAESERLAEGTDMSTAVAMPSDIDWQGLLLLLWLGGAVACLVVSFARAYQFHRLLRHARPASAAVHTEITRLANRFGMRHVPRVEVLDRAISPMLWGLFGPARILLPVQLEQEMRADQMRTLLAHELAHYRRRDHWVRLLEMVVTAVYWWNPLVWWSRPQLRATEEDCCDAWVLWALPESSRAYADALIDTASFLSHSNQNLPAPASGANSATDLKRRLTMIMNGNTSRTLNRAGRFAILGLAALVLPPAFAQERRHDRPDSDRSQRRQRQSSDEVLSALRRSIEILHDKGESNHVGVLKTLYGRIERARSGARRGAGRGREARKGKQVRSTKARTGRADKAAQVGRKIREAVVAGKITKEQAREKIVAYKKSLAGAKKKGRGGDAREVGLKLKAAVKSGRITKEQAREKIVAYKKSLAGAKKKERGDDARSMGMKLRQAVQNGRITKEQAREKMEAYKKSQAGAKKKSRSGEAREVGLKLKAAVKSGRVTKEQARARYEGYLKSLEGGKKKSKVQVKRTDLEGEAKRAGMRIRQAIADGKLSPAEGRKRFEAYMKARKAKKSWR